MVRLDSGKCECGHYNETSTVLCEACGKPLDDDEQNKIIDMKYDGVSRKSQTGNDTVLDRIWRFFSSVQTAITLLVVTLIVALLGTIYPQESHFNYIEPAQYYLHNYGISGYIYYVLGLSHIYESWWFISLLVMIGASLIICSLDRVVPLYRALHQPHIYKHKPFLVRQRIVYEGNMATEPAQWLLELTQLLQKRNYRIWRDGQSFMAEKNRFSRWGPYINHIGLIIFLLALLAREIPGWQFTYYDEFPQGEAKAIPDTPYYVQNDKSMISYDSRNKLMKTGNQAGQSPPPVYKTKATLFQCVAQCNHPIQKPTLKPVAKHVIQVNAPLVYQGIQVYQNDIQSKLVAIHPVLMDKHTGQVFGKFELRLHHTATDIQVGPYSLTLTGKYADVTMDRNGILTTRSQDPNDPAFSFLIKGPGLPATGVPYFYVVLPKTKMKFQQDEINSQLRQSFAMLNLPQFHIGLDSMDDLIYTNSTSYLTVRKETALPLIWFGALFSVVGLFIGSYWQHRRIWILINHNYIILGAHTNKNWYGMRHEVAGVLQASNIKVSAESIDRGGDKR